MKNDFVLVWLIKKYIIHNVRTVRLWKVSLELVIKINITGALFCSARVTFWSVVSSTVLQFLQPHTISSSPNKASIKWTEKSTTSHVANPQVARCTMSYYVTNNDIWSELWTKKWKVDVFGGAHFAQGGKHNDVCLYCSLCKLSRLFYTQETVGKGCVTKLKFNTSLSHWHLTDWQHDLKTF